VNGILDRRIACGFHDNQPAQRISLWRAAFPGMGRLQKAITSLLIGAGFAFLVVRERNRPDVYFVLALAAPLAGGMFWLLGSSFCWHYRLKSFAYELLRPVSRRSLRSDFFRSLLGDLGASLLMTLPLACIGYFLWQDVAIEIRPWTTSFCFFSMGALIFGLGVFASIALIRRTWLAMIAIFLIYFAFVLIVTLTTIIDWELTFTELLRISMALAVLGSAMSIFAWRRFLHIEWGKNA